MPPSWDRGGDTQGWGPPVTQPHTPASQLQEACDAQGHSLPDLAADEVSLPGALHVQAPLFSKRRKAWQLAFPTTGGLGISFSLVSSG